MVEASNIRPHMEVRSADGAHYGTVDGLEGDRIKLTRNDSPDGQHHYVPLSAIDRVDDHVHLAEGTSALDEARTTLPHSSRENAETEKQQEMERVQEEAAQDRETEGGYQ